VKTISNFVLAAALLLCGCGGSASGPTVTLVSVKFEDATALETTAKFTLRLSNENTDPVHITGEVHKIHLNGLYVGKGLSDQTIDLPRLSTTTHDVTVHLSNIALVTRLKPIVESKSFEYRVASVFHGKSWMDRMSSENTGKLELKDLVPELNDTNAPPAVGDQRVESKE
jgi:LEA14-like dessication related protein